MIQRALLTSLIEQAAERTPAKVGVICGSVRLTYSALDAAANRLAHKLKASGVRPDDRVALQLDDPAAFIVSLFAILKLGAVAVPIAPTTKPARLSHILDDCSAATLIGGSKTTSVASVTTLSLDSDDYPDHKLTSPAIDADLAVILYTSGSTGEPKGVMLSHLNIMSAVKSITQYLGHTSEDTILNVLPLSHTYGLYQVLTVFRCGGTLIVDRNTSYPAAIINLLQCEKVTGFPLVPTILARLLDHGLTDVSLPHLRYITNAAAALPLPYIHRLRRAFPHVQIYCMYGLTECARASYLPPEELGLRSGSVGRGIPNVDVYLADNAGRRLPAGSTGELVVRGSNIMLGYWGDAEATTSAIRTDERGRRVLHTGDIFRTDDQDYLYFVGRKHDMIKTRGEKVSPVEVENVLIGIPDVIEAAVVGRPDATLGEAIHAFVVLRTNSQLTIRDILSRCALFLEAFKVPKTIEIVCSLPRLGNGKLDRRALVALKDK